MNIESLYYSTFLNANKVDEQTYITLKESIERVGFLDPDIYHTSDGEIISGNHRVRIARELGNSKQLVLHDLGDISQEMKIYYAEMFNTRGTPVELLKAIRVYYLIKNNKKNKKELADLFHTTAGFIQKLNIIGKGVIEEHPWLKGEVDGIMVTVLHAYYIIQIGKSKRTYKGELSKPKKEEVMKAVVAWLKIENKNRKIPVGVDELQAKIRMFLVDMFKLELPKLTDAVDMQSVWHPMERVETVKHLLEEGAQLGTYKISLRSGAIGRLTRFSTFSASVSCQLIQLLSIDGSGFKKLKIVDPFCGMGIRIVVAKLLSHDAIGYDVSKETIARVKSHWDEYSSSFKVNDSQNIPEENSSVDLVFTSPPYWRVEVYKDEHEQENIQLSTIKDYDIFLDALYISFDEIIRILKPGGFFAIVVSNFRHNTKYYPFVFHVESYLSKKLFLFDKIILAHKKGRPGAGTVSLLHNHTKVAHEELLIFKKGA
jgi:SAM-dependent methyltransferase